MLTWIRFCKLVKVVIRLMRLLLFRLPHESNVLSRETIFTSGGRIFATRSAFNVTIWFRTLHCLISICWSAATCSYISAEAQLQALSNFYSSLEDNGFLLLGRAEALVARPQRSLFTPVHLQSRTFTKVRDAHRNGSLLPLPTAPTSISSFQ